MSEPRVHVTLDREDGRYRPGEILSAEYRIAVAPELVIQALELSVLWHTEGKGDEDLSVHLFKRFSVAEGETLDLAAPGRFSTQLPASPLSYDGAIFQIIWSVRLRLFLSDGREFVRDEPFQLGQVAPAPRELP